MAADEQDPRPGDTDNNLLRKLLLRMKTLIAAVTGGGGGVPVPLPVIVEPGDIEIGAVEIKDSTTDNRTAVINAAPTTEYGVVVRNIPSGTQVVDGSGVVQPVSGTVSVGNFPATQPVSGTVTANQGTPNSLANAWPVELSDGTFLLGTAAHPVRIDPTGTTTQPISAASLPLPTGAATEATLATRLADATFTARINTLGQKTMANSTPVVIASDQTTLPVTVTFPATQVVTGDKTNNNAAPDATNFGVLGARANAAAPTWTEGRLVLGSVDLSGNWRVINPVQLPAALVGGRLDTNIGAWLGSTAPTVGSKTSANSVPVVIASDQASVAVTVGNFPATQPVSGTVTANQGTPNSLANAWPVELSDGTFLLGTAAHPVRIDPTGTTTQPISAASLPLPTGAAQDRTTSAAPSSVELSDGAAFYTAAKTGQFPSALVGGRLDTNIGAWLGSTAPTVGQKSMANSVPVVISSDQATFPVTVTFPGTQVIAGAKTNNNAVPGSTNLGTLPAIANAAAPTWTETFQVGLSVDLSGNLRNINPTQLPAALVGGRLDVNIGTWLGSTAPTVGQKTMSNSIPMVLASDQSTIVIAGAKTNNNAAPGATNIGALTALANAAVPTWTEGDLVLQSVDLSGNLRTINPVQLPAALVGSRLDINNGAWLGSTAPTVGQKTMANSVPVVLASDQSTIVIAGAKTNNNAAPGATNIGALGFLANAAAPTWTEGDLVLGSADLSGNARTLISSWFGSTAPTVGSKTSANSIPVVIASDQAVVAVTGNKTNNNAAPGATNIGTLPALANAAAPTWTEGDQVTLSEDLSGNLRTVLALNQGKTINRFVLAQGSTAGTTQIAAADATKKNKVVGAFFTMQATGTAKFTATADLTGAMDVAAQGGFVLPTSLPNVWIETPVNQALSIVTTGGGANGVILYIVEA